MSAIPPLLDERPAGTSGCSRWLGDHNCDVPATVHVAWTPDMENGLACPEHWAEAKAKWAFYDHHPFGGFCTMPGTDWHVSWEQPSGEGFCALPLEDEATVQAVITSELEAMPELVRAAPTPSPEDA